MVLVSGDPSPGVETDLHDTLRRNKKWFLLFHPRPMRTPRRLGGWKRVTPESSHAGARVQDRGRLLSSILELKIFVPETKR